MEQEYRLSNNPSAPGIDMMPSTIIREDASGIREYSMKAIHLSHGRLFIEGEINSEMAASFTSTMLHLADTERPVSIFINSPGGSVSAGLAMYDIIRTYPHEIEMYCTGLAASMAAILFAGGQKGRRFMQPHAKVMIHEPLIAGGLGGSATTIEKTAQSILETRSLVNGILAKCTGKSVDEINKLTVSDYYMDAEEAISFGICDAVRSIF